MSYETGLLPKFSPIILAKEQFHNSYQGVGAVGELLIKSVFVATSWDGFG